MKVAKILACMIVSLLAHAAIACSPPPPKVGPDGRQIFEPYQYNYFAVVVGVREVVLPFGRERTPKVMQALDLQVVESSNADVTVGSRQLVVYPGVGADCSSEPRSYNVDRRWEYFPVGARVSVRGNRLDAAFVGNAPADATSQSPVELSFNPSDLVPLENWQVTLVTAKAVPQLGNVHGISETFNFEGRIYAHSTLTTIPGKHAGQANIEVRWFNGDRLVAVQKAQQLVRKSPYYLASSTSGTALGQGSCRVELHANGKLIATKEFEVLAQ